MTSQLFQLPAGQIARPIPTLEVGASLMVAVQTMREEGVHHLPITENGQLLGVLNQQSLHLAIGSGVDTHADVAQFISDVATVEGYRTGGEAFRQLESHPFLLAVDDDRRVIGIIDASSFWHSPPPPQRPALVGGMATPFGVYLTNGAVAGGKKGINLVLTGSLLFTFFLSGKLVTLFAEPYVPRTAFWDIVIQLVPTALLLATFRLMPIAGYHAAEHQVVHAIEQGEELRPEIVRRMPRVHPRCGTNIAVGITMFTSIWQTPWVKYEDVRLLAALLTTLFFWRILGSFVQKWITTRPASEKQIASGIQAAEQLMANYATAHHRVPNPFVRIFNSGMLHVMLGSLLAYGIASLVASCFGIPLGSL